MRWIRRFAAAWLCASLWCGSAAAASGGNCAIWIHARNKFTATPYAGTQAGFDAAKVAVGTNGSIFIYGGCEGSITIGTLQDSVFVYAYDSAKWTVYAKAGSFRDRSGQARLDVDSLGVTVRGTGIIPRLGLASSAGSGGAVRMVDGVTFAQSGAGLSAAISDLPAAGGTVVAPQGEYLFSTAVIYTGTGSVKIVGGGPGVTIFKQANSANIGTGLLVFGGLAGANEVSNISVSGITFDGNRANNTTNFSTLLMRNVAYGDVENCEFKNSTDIGLGIGDGSDASTSSFYVRVRSCISRDNKGNGFDMANSAFGSFSNNVSRNNGGVGFFCGHGISYDHVYTNNLSEANGNDGFQVTVGSGDTVAKRIIYSNNIARADSLNGFRAVSSLAGKQINNVFYIGNEAYSNGVAGTASHQNGFLLDGADVTQCVISGNRALADDGTTTQKYGVMSRNSASDNVIVNNSLQANNTGATSLVGSNLIYGNKTTAGAQAFTAGDSANIRLGLYLGGRFIPKLDGNSATLNFGAPAAVPGSVDLTISVPGAAFGNRIAVGAPITIGANYILTGFVSAGGTVTIRWTQIAGAAADPDGAGGTYAADVIQ